ncbi:MAG: hypothetical protein P4L62_00895 [Candidatus Pacebacteria bacterium]|nr:hypothetical protein [Candidatus Paceibacterota bacterium]
MKITKKTKTIDSFCRKDRTGKYFDYPLARFARRYSGPAVLYSSKYGRVDNFSTDNLYLHYIKSDKKPDFSSFDGFLRFEKKIPLGYAIKNRLDIRQAVVERYGGAREYFMDLTRGHFGELSPVKLWNVSIVGALFVGMFLMTSIYRYLGQDAGAAGVQVSSSTEVQPQVLGDQTENVDSGNTGNSAAEQAALKEYVAKIMSDYQRDPQQDQQEFLTQEMTKLVKGYPIEEMVPYIAKQDKVVAAFMIAIAKQESDWGVHVPVDPDGNDCFNYWGWRGKNAIGTAGHSCFASREQAVDTVAKRLNFLISDEKINTPGKMVVVWKCGYDCSWDNPAAVDQWVYAVNLYLNKLNVSSS